MTHVIWLVTCFFFKLKLELNFIHKMEIFLDNMEILNLAKHQSLTITKKKIVLNIIV